MDRQPHLITRLVEMRPMTPADWKPLFAAASDPQVWALHPAPDRWQEPVFRAFFEQGLESGGSLVAVDPGSGEIIGHSRYDLKRAGPGEVEIGWTFLARAYWGGTMNAAMKRAMLVHAFHDVERVIFVVGEHNLRSRRAMAKIGGRLTDRIHESPDSPQGRHVIYAIDRDSFVEGPLMRPGAGPEG